MHPWPTESYSRCIYQGIKNIWCLHTKFSRVRDLAPGICTPLAYRIILKRFIPRNQRHLVSAYKIQSRERPGARDLYTPGLQNDTQNTYLTVPDLSASRTPRRLEPLIALCWQLCTRLSSTARNVQRGASTSGRRLPLLKYLDSRGMCIVS